MCANLTRLILDVWKAEQNKTTANTENLKKNTVQSIRKFVVNYNWLSMILVQYFLIHYIIQNAACLFWILQKIDFALTKMTL